MLDWKRKKKEWKNWMSKGDKKFLLHWREKKKKVRKNFDVMRFFKDEDVSPPTLLPHPSTLPQKMFIWVIGWEEVENEGKPSWWYIQLVIEKDLDW